MAVREAESDPSKYPGFTGVGHPELFTTVPPQPTEIKIGQLPSDKIKEYFEQGFTVVENFFTPEEMEPCRKTLQKMVDDVAQKLYKTGRIKNLYEDHGLEDRLIMIEKEWPGAVVLLLKEGKLTPELQAMYESEKLLNVMEQILGPEIAANPVWNIRPKTPGVTETDNPWHQDAAYFDTDCYETLVGTAWIAVVDANVDNGCMQFCKGGHRKGMVGVHTCRDEFYLAMDDAELVNRLGADPQKDIVHCPVKAGGVVFFNNLAPHRSLPNLSNHIRWAVDLRYQSPNRPWGFYGLKDGIVLRSPDQPNLKPDWNFYNTQDRYNIQKEYEIKKLGHGEVDQFDTTITGPYMEMWKITGHNKHLDQFLDEKSKQ